MLFWVAGLFGTAYALSIHSLTLLYLFYGIIGGIGLGIGYITPVSTLVKYFPNRPGFATGLAIMGFGFASLIAGPLMQYLVAHVGLVNNFIILGITYLSSYECFFPLFESTYNQKNRHALTRKINLPCTYIITVC